MGHLITACGLGASAAGCAIWNGTALWQAGLLYAASGVGMILLFAAVSLLRPLLRPFLRAALAGRGQPRAHRRAAHPIAAHPIAARVGAVTAQDPARLATHPRKAAAGLRSGGRPVASQNPSHSASSAWTSRPGASVRALSSAAAGSRGASSSPARA